MGITIILLTIILGLFIILLKKWAKVYDYWKERGLVHIKPYPIVGNMLENVLARKTIGEICNEIANKYKQEKNIGIYTFITADLLVNDADYVQNVLVKEFSHFVDRLPERKHARFMEKNLFVLTGAEWKGVRTKLSPAFSSGKQKGMFPLMLESFDNTSKLIDSKLQNDSCLNLKEIIDMYIVTVSATTIFGMDPKKLTDPNSEFKKIVDETSRLSFWQFIVLTLSMFLPDIAYKLNINQMNSRVENYFINLILNTFKDRVESGVARDDLVQQLLQLKQNGKIEVSQWVKEDTDEFGSLEPSSVTETVEITDSILASQGLIFLMAGLEPLRAILEMLVLELSRNKDILDKLREDIDRSCNKHGGMTWQAVKDMEYLDWCLSETLRLYTPVEITGRLCVKDYTFPDGFTVEKGTRVTIPIMKFHMDPNYFPEPEKFTPERFATPPPPWVYMPFGLGPRICIARRFALQEMKVFMVRLVQDYDFSFNSKTQVPIKTDKWFFLRRHSSPIYINFSKRNRN